MRVLVTGADGQLGRAVVAAGARRWNMVGVDLPDGDLTDPTVAPRLLAGHRPDHVIHCAAYTQVDRAETERELALHVNAEATDHLVRACAPRDVSLTFVSTDYVFAGDVPEGYAENAPRNPVNWYGESKARGEIAVEAMTGVWRIVRTSWLFGHGPQNFVRTILRLLDDRPTLRIVDDQRGCPTYTVDLALVLCELVDRGATGVFHATNRGVCTWYDLACQIARLAGHEPRRIEPCTTDAFPTAARRPRCSILRDTRLASVGLPPRPDWRDALERYLKRGD